MRAYSIDRCLETAVKNGASDLTLVPGLPPTIRLDAHLRQLETCELSAEDTADALKSLAPSANPSS